MNRQSTAPMSRHSTAYPCSCSPSAPHKHHAASHATSSAFSASANPDEDWTKITDLAERRRIQNRIAQRNYRKKLKRRLEDLERRAGSSSASPSPEQKYVQLDRVTVARSKASNSSNSSSSRHSSNDSYISNQGFEYLLPSQKAQSDDKGMFSYQHTRQLSTSPPPLTSYQSYSTADSTMCGPDMPKNGYFSLPITSADATYLLSSAHGFSNCLPNVAHTKQEYYEDDMNPFGLSYASMAGVDVPAPYNYHTPMTLTPALSDSFEHSTGGSPLDFPTYPLTPAMPLTPPHSYDMQSPFDKL